MWDQDSVKRHESKFKHGKRVLRKLWFQDGELGDEKRWDDKGTLIFHSKQRGGKKEVILDKR